MSMYVPRVSMVPAVLVELADSQVMVFSIDGKPEAVPADAFHRLFREAEPAGAGVKEIGIAPQIASADLARKAKPVVKVQRNTARKQLAAAEPKSGSGMSTLQAVMAAVAEQPRTMAETQDRVCILLDWPMTEKKYRDRVYQCIWAAVKEGKLEKRTDHKTQLSHLFAAAAVNE